MELIIFFTLLLMLVAFKLYALNLISNDEDLNKSFEKLKNNKVYRI